MISKFKKYLFDKSLEQGYKVQYGTLSVYGETIKFCGYSDGIPVSHIEIFSKTYIKTPYIIDIIQNKAIAIDDFEKSYPILKKDNNSRLLSQQVIFPNTTYVTDLKEINSLDGIEFLYCLYYLKQYEKQQERNKAYQLLRKN